MLANKIKKNRLRTCVFLIIAYLITIFYNQAFAQVNNSTVYKGPYTFTLKNAATTSAGVFANNGTLIRTLWTLVSYQAGTYMVNWDGKDDDGNQMPNGNYLIKVVSNNIKYTWEGVIGNTSTNQTGSTVHRGLYYFMTGMTIINNTAYYCSGYSEARPSIFKFSTFKPQEKLDIKGFNTTTANTDIVVSDGKTVYWAGYDPYSPATAISSWVYATKVADDSDVTFSGGVSFKPTHAINYNAIGFSNEANSIITGLAVQKTGNYLFVARSALNKLLVINKLTGNLVQTLSINSIKALCVDINDNLWMVSDKNKVSKYTVNSNGTLSNAILSIQSVLQPIALAVSPDNSTILVADGDISSQQVKAFDNFTGSSLWILGDAGGYMTNPTVSNNKFYFNDVRGGMYGGIKGFLVYIAFQPDGSFWVNDPGNYRVQHYDAKGNFINNIMSLGPSYSVWADKNDLKRVGSEFLEFKYDNTKPISGSSGWTFVKNWGAVVSANYDQFSKFKFVNTYTSNNVSRTFGYLRNAGANNNVLYELVEFPSGDKPLRFTGVIKEVSVIDGSGALVTNDLRKYDFKGFDGSNNPVWASTADKLADVYQLSDQGPMPLEGFRADFVTSNNKVVFYNYSTNNSNGYHLGAIQKGDNKWLWKTAKSTTVDYNGTFPDPSYFDIGNSVNNYAGSLAMVADSSIVTGYHGEFWKGSQTNKYNHYLDNGLSLGQFGKARGEFPFTDQAPAMMAGNSLTPQLVKGANNDELSLWHGDESWHAGIHKWKISGLKTIQVQSINITYPSQLLTPQYLPGIDLMANIPVNAQLNSNAGRWTFGNSVTGTSSIYSNRLSYDRLDVLINYSSNDATSAGVFQVPCDLGDNSNLNSWKITGSISYNGSDQQGAMKQYLDVLDKSGKIIVRIGNNFVFNDNINTLFSNGSTLASGQFDFMSILMNGYQSIEISAINNKITVNYAGYTITTSKYDLTSDISSPKTMRAYFQGGYNPTGRSFDFKDMRFINSKKDQTITFNSLGNKVLGVSPFGLNAFTSSGLPVNYTVVSGPAILLGNILTVTGTGKITLQANQPGNDDYNAAQPVTINFTVNLNRTDL